MIVSLPTKRISAISQDGGESPLALKLRHCQSYVFACCILCNPAVVSFWNNELILVRVCVAQWALLRHDVAPKLDCRDSPTGLIPDDGRRDTRLHSTTHTHTHTHTLVRYSIIIISRVLQSL